MNTVDKRFMDNCVFSNEIKLFYDEIKESDTPEVDLYMMEEKMNLMNIQFPGIKFEEKFNIVNTLKTNLSRITSVNRENANVSALV